MSIPPATLRHSAAAVCTHASKPERGFAVELFARRHAPLCRSITSAVSAKQAVAKAERLYEGILATAGFVTGHGYIRNYFINDPTLTEVHPRAQAAECLTLYCRIGFPSLGSGSKVKYNLSRSEAVALFDEVIRADANLIEAASSGAMIEPCPFLDENRRTDWYTIDCPFRVIDDSAQARVLRPTASILRDATRLIALDVLYFDPATDRAGLQYRNAIGSHAMTSATLRAALKAQGPRTPIKLISWLQARGLHDFADDVRAAAQNRPG